MDTELLQDAFEHPSTDPSAGPSAEQPAGRPGSRPTFSRPKRTPKVEEVSSRPLRMGFAFVTPEPEVGQPSAQPTPQPSAQPSVKEYSDDSDEPDQLEPQDSPKKALPVPKESPKSPPGDKSSGSSGTWNKVLSYVIIALAVILVITLVVIICRKIYSTQLTNLSDLLEESNKKESQLQEKLRRTDEAAREYADQVSSLQQEVDDLKKSSRYQPPVSDPRKVPTEVRPMTTDSYEEPPHDEPTSSQLSLEDRKAKLAFMNQKRRTVEEDELEAKAAYERQQQRDDSSAMQEIKELTKAGDHPTIQSTVPDPSSKDSLHGGLENVDDEIPQDMLNMINGVVE